MSMKNAKWWLVLAAFPLLLVSGLVIADRLEQSSIIKPGAQQNTQQVEKPKVTVTKQTQEFVAPDGRKIEWTSTTTASEQDADNDIVKSTSVSSMLSNALYWFSTIVFQLIVPLILVNFVVRWMMGKGAPGMSFFGGGGGQGGQAGPGLAQKTQEKAAGEWIDPSTIEIPGFQAVAGVDEAVEQLQQIKVKIKAQADAVKAYRDEEEKRKNDKGFRSLSASEVMKLLQEKGTSSRFGGVVPGCVLLEGPPGTGKTLLAKALAKEADVAVFIISGSDFVEMFVGLGANRVREMFDSARGKRPCIIFIDEIDAVGGARSGGANANTEKDQTLNQILVELQGLNTGSKNYGLWIIAATNRADMLDPALLRPGRFTWKIKVDPPHLEGRVKIMSVHINKRGFKLAPEVDLRAIASVLAGLSGADLENVVNESALYAEQIAEGQKKDWLEAGWSEEDIERNIKSSVTYEDFFEGLLRHLMGSKKNIKLNFDELLNTAVHEGGHGLATAYERWAGKADDIVRFITVEPRGNAGGLCFATPERDRFGYTMDAVDAFCVRAFGGSAAQLVVLGVKDSGPDSDFEKASDMIYQAIARWYGSPKLGPISMGKRGQTMSTQMGERLKNEIDTECRMKTKTLYMRSWWIMKTFVRSEHLWTMYWEMLENGVLRQDRFAELFDLMMKDLAAHPDWQRVPFESYMASANPDTWQPEPLDAATRQFIDQQVAELRARYEQLEAQGGTKRSASPTIFRPALTAEETN